MCNNISTALKYVAASDNTYVTLAAFSIPVVNIVGRKIKEDNVFQKIVTDLDNVKPLYEQRTRFQKLFLVGMLTQTIVALACGALALTVLFPVTTITGGLCLAAFAIFGTSAAVSLPAHFSLNGYSFTFVHREQK